MFKTSLPHAVRLPVVFRHPLSVIPSGLCLFEHLRVRAQGAA